MANITRYDPFNVDEMFDDFFKGFFVRPIRYEGTTAAAEMQIKMDISEDDKNYMIRAEMPGVKKEDINVAIEGNQVTISAETKKESEQKEGEKILRSERYFGKLMRMFTLAHDVDESHADAKFTDGVLQLTLPKKASSQVKRLAVH